MTEREKGTMKGATTIPASAGAMLAAWLRAHLGRLGTALIALLAVLLLGTSLADAAMIEPLPNGEEVKWQSLGSEWGYKLAISKRERCPHESEEAACRAERDTHFFEIQRIPVPTQMFTVYPDNLPSEWAGVSNVWIGVAPVLERGRPPAGPYSPEAEVPVGSKTVGAAEAPRHVWSEGGTASWDPVDMGEWGYKVAVSNLPRCFTEHCRSTQFFEVGKTAEPVQSFSPCLEQITRFTPIEGLVYVGLGTLAAPATDPDSYSGSEVAVTVPKCPQPPPYKLESTELPPVDGQAPAVTGTPVVGYLLTATPGVWLHTPSAYSYQWQICDATAAGCQNVSGGTGTSFPVTSGDLGHQLRVAVTASNASGSALAVSAPSPLIGSRIEAGIEWAFRVMRSYTVIESLVTHGIPAEGRIQVLCRGHGCPFKTLSVTPGARRNACHSRHCVPPPPVKATEAELGHLFRHRHLRPGTVITVRVTKPGWVGRVFQFTIRANRRPSRAPGCLAPESTQRVSC